MSKVFLFIIGTIVAYIFIAWAVTEIGETSSVIEADTDFNVTGTPEYVNETAGVLTMLWNAATFQIEGIPGSFQVMIFGTLNLCLGIALLFLLRGVG